MIYILTVFLGLFIVPSTIFAEIRFPAPEFDSGYRIPSSSMPLPGGDYSGYINLAVLVVVLFTACWLLFKKRSRKGILVLSLFSLFYFGFVRHGCVCVVGSLQNVVLALCDSSYYIPVIILIYFILPLMVALFFGRVFCGAACPLGIIQDIVLWRPVKVPVWLEHVLGLIPYIYFGLAVLFAATGAGFIICRYDPFVAIFRISG